MIEEFKETHGNYITTLDVSNPLKGAYLSLIYLTMTSIAKPTKHILVG
jgi:hypothetical protein